ncbi:MAG: cytochrome ubiquinol oxidase subunit I [Bacteroidales bacterium]|nr:cytochrome ubiquinol oxidase subunit I [Bacteroidales bacterium]
MYENLVELSRWQFAVTAMYHWLFVPLTLGLGFIIAFMETKYYRTGDEFWKRTTKFWMKLFAINFAVGIATGIILEFEFGTNWSNYSWFVGDIFGAPLAIEGIFAFFMESTFFAIMYFGWEKVSKKAHLVSTWLTAIGTNLSALWILTANAWMQYPVGMAFNPETARNEMVDFWSILLSPVAINKFLHAVTNGYVLAAVVVIAVSAWFILKQREQELARKSIKVASIFGLASLIVLIGTGDGSAYNVAKVQPMKLAAMEGLYDGQEGAPLVAFGILNPDKEILEEEGEEEDPYLFDISFPKVLSFLATRDFNGFVPGVNDIIEGGYEFTDMEGNTYIEPSFEVKKEMGSKAVNALASFQTAKESGNQAAMDSARAVLDENFKYFGYHYVEEAEDLVPNVPLVFYAFHIMVTLGMFFIVLFIAFWILERKNLLEKKKFRWVLWIGIISVPLVYICSQSGWIVAEVGRQPWTIQNLLTTNASVSGVGSGNVLTTLILFIVLFTTMLIAELSIMFKQIKKGA